MKARLITFAFVSLLVCLAAQQAVAQIQWDAGFKGGMSLAKIKGDTRISETDTGGIDTLTITGDVADSRTGFLGGGFVTANFNERFGVRLELLYAQKGGKGSFDAILNGVPVGTVDATFKLDYFEIPVLLVGTFPSGGNTKLSVFGGPAVAFKSAAKLRFEAQGQSDEQDIGDTVEGTDFGVAVGAGISFAASQKARIIVDGRYTFGMSKFPNTGEDLKNSALVFMAGLSFPLGSGTTGP